MNLPHGLTLSVSLWLGLFAAGLSAAEADNSSPQIVLTTPESLADSAMEVRNLPASLVKQMTAWKADDPRFGECLSVYVGKSPEPKQPAMLGTIRLTKQGLAFVPRFGWEAGLTYSVKLTLPEQKPRWNLIAIPADAPSEPTTISAVYPTGDKLPENLLRFYLHFSAPMSQGRSYRYLHLIDQAGKEVANPFLELPQELWSPDGKRLTVLLDPGRVKQGLKPREQSGPVLVPGREYTFTIDADWLDAKGNPLAKPFKKKFKTTEADIIQPDPKAWKISPPQAGSREPVSVEFDEPLDQAMLEHVLSVVDAQKAEILGSIQIDRHETRWRFTPKTPWEPGRYGLRIQTKLEDRVGNSIARPFEVDLNEPPPPNVPKILTRRFEIAE